MSTETIAQAAVAAAPSTTETASSAAPTGGVAASGVSSDQATAPVLTSGGEQSTATAAPAGDQAAPVITDVTTPPAADPAKPAAPSAWGDDWRDRMANGDDKIRAMLERLSDPTALALKLRNQEIKISQGIKPEAPGEEATDEERAAYRKQMGIPDSPTDYKIELREGLVVGDADKPLLDAFLEDVHGKGWSQQQASEAMSWYFEHQERIIQAQDKIDEDFKQESEARLKEAWGGEFKRNLNLMQNLLAGAPAGVADRFLAGRTADGRMVGDDPQVLSWLVNLARDVNPTATLLPAGMDNLRGVEGELADIKKLMADPTSEYWKGPKAGATQERYRQLLTAQKKIAARQ